MDFILDIIKSQHRNNDVMLAKKGDKQAFERLIDEYKLSLFRISKSILRKEEDIEDAFQETIIKVYEKIVYLRKEEYFKTWLIKILINECNTILRNRKKTIYMEEINTHDSEIEDSYKNFELMNAINSLEEELRTVTLLFYYEDMPQKTIADILGIPNGTVRSRLSRARKKLRELLNID